MESYDIKFNGIQGVLFLENRTIRIDTDEGTIVKTDNLLSVGMVGTERLKLVWGDDDGNKTMTIKVTSAPASMVYEKILNPKP